MFVGTALSIFSSFLIALSFPKFNFSFLIWFAFVPMFFAMSRKKTGKRLIFAFITGLTANIIQYYWLVATCVGDGESVLFGILTLSALAVYLSIYYAVYGLFFGLFFEKLFAEERFLTFTLSSACSWVVLEYFRGIIFTGFPWLLVGHSAWANIQLIQMADVFGVYGISFLIIAVNSTVFTALKGVFNSRQIFFTVCLAVICLAYGFYRYESISKMRPELQEKIKISLLQISVDQYKKWDDAYEKEVFADCRALLSKAEEANPDLVVWPETSIPYAISQDGITADPWIRRLLSGTLSRHLIGTVVFDDGKLFNSAYLLDHSMNIAGRYDKFHLLPFGEYIPFEKYLTEIIKPLSRLGGFSAQTVLEPVRVGLQTAGVTICYESIFPYISRTLANKGSNFLVNLTNDAWFFETSAPYQHLIMNVFRAVENRLNLARCANTGISAFIKPTGVISSQSALYEKTVLTDELVLLNCGGTFYQKHGDIFVLISAVFSSIITILCILSRKRRRWKAPVITEQK